MLGGLAVFIGWWMAAFAHDPSGVSRDLPSQAFLSLFWYCFVAAALILIGFFGIVRSDNTAFPIFVAFAGGLWLTLFAYDDVSTLKDYIEPPSGVSASVAIGVIGGCVILLGSCVAYWGHRTMRRARKPFSGRVI
jgi:hypothetical protein